MTELEDRLRRDLTALADRAQPGAVRPLREPHRRRSDSVTRWLAPITAMAAVAVVSAGVVLVSQAAGQRQAQTGGPAATPPYYVTLSGAIRGHQGFITATVRNSQTGAVLSSVQVLHRGPTKIGGHVGTSLMPAWITAAADGRTFAITDIAGTYLLHVGAGGKSVRLQRLPATVPNTISDPVALSPDGHQLAIDTEACQGSGPCREGIEVISLVTGVSRVWLGPTVAGSPLVPAWVDRGKKIMFLWQVGDSAGPNGYRLLGLATSGGSLLADSVPMVSPPTVGGWLFPAALLTPDGRALITTDFRNFPGKADAGIARLRIVELSATTGRLLRVLRVQYVPYNKANPSWPTVDSDCNVLSLAPSGLHLLVQCAGFGRLDGSRFTPLPGVPGASTDARYGFVGVGGTAAW